MVSGIERFPYIGMASDLIEIIPSASDARSTGLADRMPTLGRTLSIWLPPAGRMPGRDTGSGYLRSGTASPLMTWPGCWRGRAGISRAYVPSARGPADGRPRRSSWSYQPGTYNQPGTYKREHQVTALDYVIDILLIVVIFRHLRTRELAPCSALRPR